MSEVNARNAALLGLSLLAVVGMFKASGGKRGSIKAVERTAQACQAKAQAKAATSRQPQKQPIGINPGQGKQLNGAENSVPWMASIKKALNHGGSQRPKRDRSEAKRKQLQLATVDPATGCPSVRTIVFRGFLPSHIATSGNKNSESCLLTFVTDDRAEKVRHIREADRAPVECCWWLDEANVQFRITGRAVLATRDREEAPLREACRLVWDRLKASTRGTFTWPRPGQPADGRAVAAKPDVALEDAHFCVLIVVPHRVDELRLGGQQRRIVHTLQAEQGEASAAGGPLALRGTSWTSESVNP